MPVANLLRLLEPAYVLRGTILAETPSGLDAGVWLFTGSDRLEGYEEPTRDVLEYFAVPRGSAEAAAGVSRWGAQLADVDELADQGILFKLSPGDVVSQLAGLSVWMTTTLAERQPSPNAVAYAVGSDRMVLISREGAAVFWKPDDSETLAAGVARVASALYVSGDHVWTRVGVDMARILTAGVGFITTDLANLPCRPTAEHELESDPDRPGSAAVVGELGASMNHG